MSARRSAAAVPLVAVLALAGCGTAHGLTTVVAAAAPTEASGAAPAADGDVDQAVEERSLADVSGEDYRIAGLVHDPDGHAVALVEPSIPGDLLLARQDDDGGWTARELTHDPDVYSLDLDVAEDGTLVASVIEPGGAVGFFRIDPDGTTTQVLAGGVSRPADVAGLSPDGRTAYFATVGVAGGPGRLVAVDTTSGAVTAEVPLDAARRPRRLEATAAGDVVLVGDVDLGGGTFLTRYTRYDAGLRQLAELPLVDGDGHGQVSDLALAPDGTAYVDVYAGEQSGPATERLVAVAPGAAAPAAISSQDVDGYTVSLQTLHGLAVDPSGTTAYLVGTDEGVVVHAIDLASGDDRILPVGDTGEGCTLSVSPDGSRVVVGGDDTVDGRTGPAVWTLG